MSSMSDNRAEGQSISRSSSVFTSFRNSGEEGTIIRTTSVFTELDESDNDWQTMDEEESAEDIEPGAAENKLRDKVAGENIGSVVGDVQDYSEGNVSEDDEIESKYSYNYENDAFEPAPGSQYTNELASQSREGDLIVNENYLNIVHIKKVQRKDNLSMLMRRKLVSKSAVDASERGQSQIIDEPNTNVDSQQNADPQENLTAPQHVVGVDQNGHTNADPQENLTAPQHVVGVDQNGHTNADPQENLTAPQHVVGVDQNGHTNADPQENLTAPQHVVGVDQNGHTNADPQGNLTAPQHVVGVDKKFGRVRVKLVRDPMIEKLVKEMRQKRTAMADKMKFGRVRVKLVRDPMIEKLVKEMRQKRTAMADKMKLGDVQSIPMEKERPQRACRVKAVGKRAAVVVHDSAAKRSRKNQLSSSHLKISPVLDANTERDQNDVIISQGAAQNAQKDQRAVKQKPPNQRENAEGAPATGRPKRAAVVVHDSAAKRSRKNQLSSSHLKISPVLDANTERDQNDVIISQGAAQNAQKDQRAVKQKPPNQRENAEGAPATGRPKRAAVVVHDSAAKRSRKNQLSSSHLKISPVLDANTERDQTDVIISQGAAQNAQKDQRAVKQKPPNQRENAEEAPAKRVQIEVVPETMSELRQLLDEWKSIPLERLLKALHLGARNNQNKGEMLARILTLPAVKVEYTIPELGEIHLDIFNVVGSNDRKVDIIRKIRKEVAGFKGVKREEFNQPAKWAEYVHNAMKWVERTDKKGTVDATFAYKLKKYRKKVNDWREGRKDVVAAEVKEAVKVLKKMSKDPQALYTNIKAMYNDVLQMDLELESDD